MDCPDCGHPSDIHADLGPCLGIPDTCDITDFPDAVVDYHGRSACPCESGCDVADDTLRLTEDREARANLKVVCDFHFGLVDEETASALQVFRALACALEMEGMTVAEVMRDAEECANTCSSSTSDEKDAVRHALAAHVLRALRPPDKGE